MKNLAKLCALALTLGAGMSMAQAATAAPAHHAQSVVKMTCQDYLALDETFKPNFIYYSVGHGKKGNPEAIFDTEGIERIKPNLDQYCAVNLSKSAYEHVMKSSMASEKTNK